MNGRSGIVTLTTDFGEGPYAAAMRGAILSAAPGAHAVDITHEIRPQEVMEGAFVLAAAAFEFPPGTVHAAVVDPGVGTGRRIVAVEAGGHVFVAPDNGLLTMVLEKARRVRDAGGPDRGGDYDATRSYAATYLRAHEVTNERYFRHPVSATFHGRDIIAPAAGAIAAGERAEALGPEVRPESLVRLRLPAAKESAGGIEGEVIFVDRFGNLVTNIEAGGARQFGVQEGVIVRCAETVIEGIAQTYGRAKTGETIALAGSLGYLEIAVINGSATEVLGKGKGTKVSISRAR